MSTILWCTISCLTERSY